LSGTINVIQQLLVSTIVSEKHSRQVSKLQTVSGRRSYTMHFTMANITTH